MSKKIQQVKRKNSNNDVYKAIKITSPKNAINKEKLNELCRIDKLHTQAVNLWIEKYYPLTFMASKILFGSATPLMQSDKINLKINSAYNQIAGNRMLDILRSHYLAIQEKIADDIFTTEHSYEFKVVIVTFARNHILFSRYINDIEDTDDIVSKWNSEYLKNISNTYYSLPDKERNIIPETIKNMFLKIREKWDMPIFKGGSIYLDYRVFRIEDANNSKHFNLWLNITSTTPRQCLPVPFKLTEVKEQRLNHYFPDWQSNKRKGLLVINNRTVYLSVPISKPTEDNPINNIYGVDIGITTPLSLDNGNQYGLNINHLVKKDIDEYLRLQAIRNKFHALKQKTLNELKNTNNPNIQIKLQQKLFEYNSHLSNKRWSELRNKIKSIVRTEIGRSVNLFLEGFKKDSLVVMEDLSDMNASNAKRTKRGKFDLSSWARGELQSHLGNDVIWYGGKVAYVIPEYSSQLCSKCSYLNSDNRKGTMFKCLNCEYTENADTNAAKNVKERFFDTEIHSIAKKYKNVDKRKTHVKDYLENKFACL